MVSIGRFYYTSTGLIGGLNWEVLLYVIILIPFLSSGILPSFQNLRSSASSVGEVAFFFTADFVSGKKKLKLLMTPLRVRLLCVEFM